MQKHIASHKSKVKFCHFFNNDKICQYVRLGCKFKHEKAPICKFDRLCRRQLCQYAHRLQNKNNETVDFTEDIIESNTLDENAEITNMFEN